MRGLRSAGFVCEACTTHADKSAMISVEQVIRRLTLSLVTFNIVFKVTVVKGDHVPAAKSCFALAWPGYLIVE